MRIDLLGPFEMIHESASTEGRASVVITATKLRQLLALLAVNADSTVSVERIIDELWPDGPPNTVKTIVQTYIHQLRKLFGRSFASPIGTDLLVTRPEGYVLAVPRNNVDVFRFQCLLDRSRDELRRGGARRATELLREALELWRGPIATDVTSGPALHGLSVYLEELRLEAVSLRIEADLADNRHREIIGELRSLIATHRLHEAFYVKLMDALQRSGRRGEALTVYRELRRILDDELGLKPSPEARQLQHEILVNQ
ncbi:AfsR/SARP family transcriptional regulator [Streptacidiphilus sp. P02-A3a]|uniref:AfsR/SARP family transcriptional regulator n=1 Tax=Streptacidiphilus sp. P02-A3a TaxID=2704468 RepID=UPI0015F904C2|nr:AfsR/SARP family transcriptional regulator [Streptacidiphilus sp. P02-A3a]QMU67351.1 AfsR/SARP family transcriptional regulator [Streptacidiphilus sp. P02-A3a]